MKKKNKEEEEKEEELPSQNKNYQIIENQK